MKIHTVGQLREAIADLPDHALIEWAYDGPKECCDGHVHDITEFWDCDATVERAGGGVEVMLTGGMP